MELGALLMRKTIGMPVRVLVAIAISPSLLAMRSGLVPTLSASVTSCVVLRGSGPVHSASIGNEQNGKTVCIAVGDRLLVALRAPDPTASPWREIRVSKTGVLQGAPLTLMFPRGTTGRIFKAVKLGTVVLTAERPVCGAAPSGTPTCNAIQAWRATVIVKAPTSMLPRPSGTGVYGLVTAGPTCPVQRVGQSCPPRPVVAEIDVRAPDGETVASTHTDSSGRYAVSVTPGAYTLVARTPTTFPRCPSHVITVRAGTPQRIDVSCDTGIR
jgi:hypothetical protein